MKKVINTSNAPKTIGPYNQAIISGNTLYCSGQIAINPSTGNLVLNNTTDETTQIMENISAILRKAKMDFSDVVKCTIFMKDINDYDNINSVYKKYFSDDFPAREAVQVSALPRNVNVEISVIAIK